MNRICLALGIGGSCTAALCCFTPLLPWLFGWLGISGLLGYVYRDDVLGVDSGSVQNRALSPDQGTGVELRQHFC